MVKIVKIKGRLYICPSPLGNLEDITLRVVRVLREADLIAAEDTRHSKKLLAHYDIHTPITSFHQHSSQRQTEKLVAAMLSGKSVALISDAGTPAISDPGQILVKACIDQGIEVDPLPGPCAAIVALSASGFPLASFTFRGFLPRKGMDKAVAGLAEIEHPVVLYESPRRIVPLLFSLNQHMPERDLLLARELTKLHQQLLRGKAAQLLDQVRAEELERGEYTVVLGPGQGNHPQPDVDLVALAAKYLGQNMSTRDAADRISYETGVSRREVYKLLNKKKDT
ncbi:MAG: 16S rRNA (cytidine(1402)-2'-O)-methyltransferase [Eubacteriales bacterium]|nr:16S rRNA (cytidine(1402)-2'-O)-methyltransferase [Eubacteriales bacterium]MDD4078257.1 16S rRNA (cytidine(1402)-2'-O)-methyltransferase [Eubacteriales bacterium]